VIYLFKNRDEQKATAIKNFNFNLLRPVKIYLILISHCVLISEPHILLFRRPLNYDPSNPATFNVNNNKATEKGTKIPAA
jgi:hypothetical protein